jgi:hypothetical protein
MEMTKEIPPLDNSFLQSIINEVSDLIKPWWRMRTGSGTDRRIGTSVDAEGPFTNWSLTNFL